MKINQVILVTACGHTDDGGKFTRGKTVDGVAEFEIVLQCLRKIEEIFEEYRIRNKVIPWEHPPGVKISERHTQVPPNSLVLGIGVGYYGNERARNSTMVVHGEGRGPKELAQLLADTLSTWGTCVSYGHRIEGPELIQDRLMNVPGCFGVGIMPFAINGPNCDEYLKHLGALSRDVAMTVVEYLSRSSSAINMIHSRPVV